MDGGDRADVVASVFRGTVNRMQSGYIMRDVLNKISEIHFSASEEMHTLSRLYESMYGRCATPPATPASSTRRGHSSIR